MLKYTKTSLDTHNNKFRNEDGKKMNQQSSPRGLMDAGGTCEGAEAACCNQRVTRNAKRWPDGAKYLSRIGMSTQQLPDIYLIANGLT